MNRTFHMNQEANTSEILNRDKKENTIKYQQDAEPVFDRKNIEISQKSDEKASKKPTTQEPTTEAPTPAYETITIPEGTRVYTKTAIDHSGDILILEIGSNGGWENDYKTLILQYDAMIHSKRIGILRNSLETAEKRIGKTVGYL